MTRVAVVVPVRLALVMCFEGGSIRSWLRLLLNVSAIAVELRASQLPGFGRALVGCNLRTKVSWGRRARSVIGLRGYACLRVLSPHSRSRQVTYPPMWTT